MESTTKAPGTPPRHRGRSLLRWTLRTPSLAGTGPAASIVRYRGKNVVRDFPEPVPDVTLSIRVRGRPAGTLACGLSPRSSGDRAPASGAGCAGSNPAGGAFVRVRPRSLVDAGRAASGPDRPPMDRGHRERLEPRSKRRELWSRPRRCATR